MLVLYFFCLFPTCSFGMIPTSPLPIHTPLMPSQSIDASLPINTVGPVMKMDPLNNLQVQKHSLTDQTFEHGATHLKKHRPTFAVKLGVWDFFLYIKTLPSSWYYNNS